jgi:hypothetical protein
VLRRQALGDEDDGQGPWVQEFAVVVSSVLSPPVAVVDGYPSRRAGVARSRILLPTADEESITASPAVSGGP